MRESRKPIIMGHMGHIKVPLWAIYTHRPLLGTFVIPFQKVIFLHFVCGLCLISSLDSWWILELSWIFNLDLLLKRSSRERDLARVREDSKERAAERL